MPLRLEPIDEARARELLRWRYEPPYELYNMEAESADEVVGFLLDPQNGYYAITDEHGDLVAFCCFGMDAQVPGGDYRAAALDIGLGVRPDLTGQGQGATYVETVIEFGRRTFQPPALRVTIAQFNQRARRVWEKAGFRPVQTFDRMLDAMPFVILVNEE